MKTKLLRPPKDACQIWKGRGRGRKLINAVGQFSIRPIARLVSTGWHQIEETTGIVQVLQLPETFDHERRHDAEDLAVERTLKEVLSIPDWFSTVH